MAEEEDQRQRLREAGEAFYRELPEHLAERMRRLFKNLDRDGNARVSREELERGCRRIESLKPFAAVFPHLFPLLDADSNGNLDFSECKALFLLLSSSPSQVECSSCASPLILLSHLSCLDCNHLPVCFHCHPRSPHSLHHVHKVVGIADDPQLYLQRVLMSSTTNHLEESGIKMNSQISSTMQNIVVNPKGEYEMDGRVKQATTVNYVNSSLQLVGNVINIGNSLSECAN